MWSLLEQIDSNTVLKNLSISIGVLVILAVSLKISDKLFKKIKDLNPDDNSFEDIIPFLHNISKAVLLIIVIYALSKVWGIDVTPLVASAGIAGIAIAFAAQDSVANLFGGISIFVDKPFKIGDQVLMEGMERGHVYHIGARSTKLTTLDNVLVTIPNSVMVKNPIYNETGYDPTMRVKVEVGVAYGSDLDEVERVVLQVLRESSKLLEDPEPMVRFTSFGDSAINLVAIGSIPNPKYLGETKHILIKDIYKALNDAGITIPFPQRDVHLDNKLL